MPTAPVLKIIVSFSGNFSGIGGAYPQAGLIADVNGNLFGTTTGGGDALQGTVFEIVNNGTVAAPVYDSVATTLQSFFGGSDGGVPYSDLIADANGDLFGTTAYGGSFLYGAAFELVNHGTAAASDYTSGATTLYSFSGGSDGANPYAGLVADGNGNLFGTTFNGGGADSYGTVFEIVNNGTAAAPDYIAGATTLYRFTGAPGDGANPQAGLIADAQGDLFGTTYNGGFDSCGTVFELVNHGTAAAPDYNTGATTLYSFTATGSDGANPYASLIADGNGNLFGTTLHGGGSDGYGTVFEIVNQGTAAAPDYSTGATTLYSFTGTGSDGANPQAGLIVDANGDLFGTTGNRGFNNDGTVFEIVNQGNAAAPNYDMGAKTVYSFTGGTSDGAKPFAGLHVDANGNLFGTTFFGGTNNAGTVFEITDSGYALCFMGGTLIRTPDGEAAIETLKRGDLVLTAEGKGAPVRWLGRQTVSTRFADPLRVLPIRVKAGALDENIPCHDLLVSPCHALLIGEVLVQAGALVNGVSILRETNVADRFVYYHLELDDHSLILAENAPAETFIDNVDRMAFDNWAEHEALYPDGKPIEELPYPRAKSRRQSPTHVRAMLDARAKALGAEESRAVA